MEVGLSSGQVWGQKGCLCCSGHIHLGGAGSQAGGGDVSLFSQETMQGGGMHEESTGSTGGWGGHRSQSGTGTAEATGDGCSPGQGWEQLFSGDGRAGGGQVS